MAHTERASRPSWHSVNLRPTAEGLIAGERFERFKVEAVTEMTLRVAAILMVMSSMLMWFLLPVDPSTGRLASFGAMASLLAAGGLGIFAYGTRGFRRQMTLDMGAGKLSLTKINMHGQARVARDIDLGTIESVFLRRPAAPGGMATLLVRVSGSNAPATALSGSTEEIERVHAELCAVLHGKPPKRSQAKPSLRLRDTPPRKPKPFAA